MSMIKGQKSSAPAPVPPPEDAGEAAVNAAAANPQASEAARFEGQNTQRPEHVPEKFWKDGKLAVDDVLKSYSELESWKNTKTEELMKQLDAERIKARPESADKYEVQPIEGIEMEDLKAHPSFQWWRDMAFELGLPTDKFNDGINQIVGIMMQGPDIEAEKAQLGENADARLHAVSAWAQKTFADPEEFQLVQVMGSTATGIKMLERLMGRGELPGEAAPPPPQIGIDDLRKMQSDPRYWNPSQRDPAFVRQVDEGFEKLYGRKS